MLSSKGFINFYIKIRNTCSRISSRPKVFLWKSVPKISSIYTGKNPCQSAISIKMQSNFIEIALRHGCSPINLLHIFRTSFTKNTSGWTVCYYHVTYEYVLLLNLLIGFIKISISDQRCIRNLVKYWRWSVCGNRSRFKSR